MSSNTYITFGNESELFALGYRDSMLGRDMKSVSQFQNKEDWEHYRDGWNASEKHDEPITGLDEVHSMSPEEATAYLDAFKFMRGIV